MRQSSYHQYWAMKSIMSRAGPSHDTSQRTVGVQYYDDYIMLGKINLHNDLQCEIKHSGPSRQVPFSTPFSLSVPCRQVMFSTPSSLEA